MAQNHENNDFECRQCGEHFHSRDDLDRHNRANHTAQAGSSSSGSSNLGSSNRGSSSNINSSNIDRGSSSDRGGSNR